jgi:mono/diheme cytochrome c family protein
MLKNIVVVAAIVLALAACEEKKAETPAETPKTETAPTPAPTPTPAPAATPPATGTATAAATDPKAEADQIFSQRCSVCHGADGKGDGPGAAALNPKPRNYTDAEWQKSVTDDYIAKVIVEGGAAVGKSPTMVANADLKDKPEVVKALVAKVRSFGGAAPAAPPPATK